MAHHRVDDGHASGYRVGVLVNWYTPTRYPRTMRAAFSPYRNPLMAPRRSASDAPFKVSWIERLEKLVRTITQYN